MLALGSGCKYRLSLAERFDCTETIINQLLADSYQNPISKWQVNKNRTSSGLPLILHYGELYNYFIIYYNVIVIEIKCTINVMCLNHPKTAPPQPRPWKNRLPQNRSLVPKRLGTAVLENAPQYNIIFEITKIVLRCYILLKFNSKMHLPDGCHNSFPIQSGSSRIFCMGTSLVVQWLRLCTPNAGGPGSVPGQGTRSHMPQLKILHAATKIPHATTKTRHSQINKYF